MSLTLKCDNCGVEVRDPNQEICEICGGLITPNKVVKEASEAPTVIRNISNEKPEKQRRRHRCC